MSLANSGLKGSIAGQALRRHTRLAKPTKRMAGLVKTGMEFLMRKAR
ncbi:hypothetical protein [Paenibacillus larvae]|nr:hypothetical protein [Paenibacillus larvae]MDT2193406.1 hypothetical protein [Paenibacillus larvae]